MGFDRKSVGALIGAGSLVAAMTGGHEASALTIAPTFDASVSAPAKSAIETAISTIDSLYTNPGTISVYFEMQDNSSFVGESAYEYYLDPYANFEARLTADATANPSNSVLATGLAHLASGNQPGSGGAVLVTSAFARLVLDEYAAPGVQIGTTDYDGEIVLSDYYNLNYTTTPVAGAYSAIATAEHELDEVLGGGGAGSALNFIANEDAIGNHTFDNDIGVLDPYRYSAPGVKSFTPSSSATSYFSVNGGTTDIVAFNQNGASDYGDFAANGDVQSANGTPGIVPAYTASSPEAAMMEAIGYDGAVPEPASIVLLASGAAGIAWIRRRRNRHG